MKDVFIIFLLLSSQGFSQTRIGVINDPDGYSNVRQEKSTQSQVVGKIFDLEVFEYLPDASDWFSVTLRDGKIGYVHKSRILEVNKCQCINSSEPKPQLIVTRARLIQVCGFIEKKMDDGRFMITESLFVDCATGEELLEIYAVDHAAVHVSGDELIVTKLMNLPVGKNWSYEETPITVWRLSLKSNNSKFVESAGLKPPYVTKEQSEELVKLLKASPPKDGSEFEEIMDKLFIAAISGDAEAEKLFLEHRDAFGFVLDGYLAEEFSKLKTILIGMKTN